MSPTFLQIVLLGLIQGAAELLPVSSSAHVIAAEKLMGLNPSSPEMTFLLIMLHTGTMGAVIVYFWNDWRRSFFSSVTALRDAALRIAAATVATAVVYEAVMKVFHHRAPKAEVEELFSNLTLIAAALAAAGLLILAAGLRRRKEGASRAESLATSLWIGFVQGFCLPFRGFSRSGATISTGILLGIEKRRTEEFSFALAVVLTPPAIAVEWLRLRAAHAAGAPMNAGMGPGVLGLACSFVSGLGALRWLSRWLEGGKWHYFGIYCLMAAAGLYGLARAGY